MILGVFSPQLEAQPGQDPNYQYPELSERDFQLFINILDYINQGRDPKKLARANNLSDEYTRAVITKIMINTVGKVTDTMDEMESEYGTGILFNGSEMILYEKYEEEIMAAIVKFDEAGKGDMRGN
ncbi:MAG: hypothetical protein LBD41_04280 [Clostridiales Family XIII bacterium]|jgi:hypothetical protein|nr:hypothetical protein [Clostridiales Family XIII bacterium]